MVDQVFLDANVLFAAAYSEANGLLRLREQPEMALCTSGYAAAEARRNLQEPTSRSRLERLLRGVEVHPEPPPGASLPAAIRLPEKDAPILIAAIHVGATHFLTGDVRHFGDLFGHTVGGVLLLRPATYLRSLDSTAARA